MKYIKSNKKLAFIFSILCAGTVNIGSSSANEVKNLFGAAPVEFSLEWVDTFEFSPSQQSMTSPAKVQG